MSLKQRIMNAAGRTGLRSVNALAKACGVSHVWMGEVVSGSKPGFETIEKIAKVTGVSANWLRDGLLHDAPDWARDPLIIVMNDAQEAVRRLHEKSVQCDALVVENAQLRAELATAKDALAKLALRMADEPEPVRTAAAGRTRYRIGQTKAPARTD
jgi:transcriptional regulator with XRE-family HTH domain